ncbi:alpha/beta hydrolase domain-containing protein [Phenylobacterium immobile]|uniref:alpha/beta hydrolase domain-containing protein n=1 Tax=Phenylobacterium immobile TaxID=21 RepID=UPI000AFA3176|nr:alpha/beta hydrolase domain-containing protein [Phenylobacterium immobile]
MAVERLELQTTACRDGEAFGAAGPYDLLKGLAFLALDPNDPADALVTDLGLAPRDADGRVRFEADVEILRPIDPARRNGRLLLDAVNRGASVLRSLDEAWVLGQGFTVVRCGWQHDADRARGLGLQTVLPTLDGRPITGRMARVFEPDAAADRFALGEPGVIPYRADPDRADEASLSERTFVGGPARILAREAWSFSEDFTGVIYPTGFTPGYAYELIFTAAEAPLTGHGLAATRDLIAFLRDASASDGNPLAGEVEHVLAFGVSQSGRFLRQMVYDGFCQDFEGRNLFDGLLIHTGGARLLESNWRLGQAVYNGWDAVSATFPFTDVTQTDPVTGITDGLLARVSAKGAPPRIVHTDTAAEYWGGQVGSLAHVSADGLNDAAVPETSRLYYLAGTQHGVTPLDGPPGRGAYPANTIDYRPLLRAALRNLDCWVALDVEPPPSRYPRLDDGTLVDRETARDGLAGLPGPGAPEKLAVLHRLEFGPTARQTRRFEQIPPERGPAYALHVSAVDADGNETAGVRHPEITAPLATYTGWNPRSAKIGGTDQNLRTAGAVIRFALTPGGEDRRPSVAERYADREAYVAAVRVAAEALIAERYMLAEDMDGVLAEAGRRYDLYTTS